MILTNEELIALMDGALDCDVDERGLRPMRFLAAQEAAKAGDEPYRVRQSATAGVSLDFETDARAISFEASITQGAGVKLYSFDLYVNGCFCDAVHDRFDEPITVGVSFDLGEGKKQVRLFLPSLACVRLSNVCLDGASYARRTARTRRFLFFGDSITQGYTAVLSSQSYANTLTRLLDASCVNQAIGGDVFNAEHLFELPYTPDTVFVAYGTNDFSRGFDLPTVSRPYFERLLSLYGAGKIVCLLPIARYGLVGNAEKNAAFLRAREDLRDTVLSLGGIRVIDTLPLLPPLEPFFHDHVHPCDLGFQQYAHALARVWGKK